MTNNQSPTHPLTHSSPLRGGRGVFDVLLGKTLTELQDVALSIGLPKFAGKQLAEWLYVRRVRTFDEMTNISLKGREALKANFIIGRHAPVREAVSADGTRKYLFEISSNPLTHSSTNPLTHSSSNPLTPSSTHPLAERSYSASGRFVEAVYIPESDRATLCVSTQAGCKMGCRFCMTGTLGFHGHLPASEILNQIFEIDAIASSTNPLTPSSTNPLTHSSTNPLTPSSTHPFSLTNLVYMGEGEPMDNIDQVLRSLEIMTAPYACAWSPKRITVSTVGIPAMKRFLDESDCHLAVSLHNPFAVERAQIMPAEKMMSITDVIDLLKQYDWSHQRRISFEYICWAGKNDTPRHAKELLRLLKGLNCRINLIRFHEGVDSLTPSSTHPFSPSTHPLTHSSTHPFTPSERGQGGVPFPASDEQQMLWFQNYLTSNGLTTTIRRSRGEDILAACGMLVNSLNQ